MPMPKSAMREVGIEHRLKRLQSLLEMFAPVPGEWLDPSFHQPWEPANESMGATHCQDYKELINGWKKAMRWREEMQDVLTVMLAIAASTNQIGDQLFLQVIGDAGGGKTRLCDAMLTSNQCFALEHLTGFHSGFKGSDGEDYSLLSRINNKTMITPEGDVLMSSPRFTEIMSQQRRIFDGTSGASYKNMKEDQRYTGLRTPWIIAGTPALMNTDQSRLGDRFLRVCIDQPDDDEKKAIIRRVAFTSMRSVMQSSEGAKEQVDERLAEAYKLTGGYVNWLRANATELLTQLEIDEETVADRCGELGQFVADLRARPDPDPRKDSIPTKEMPTRLTSQFVRLACCLAVVMNKKGIDLEVMRIVKKVALDTARGQSLDIVRFLSLDKLGSEVKAISLITGRSDQKTRDMLMFMRSIGIVETFTVKIKNFAPKPKWRLTPDFQRLYAQVFNGER